MKDHFDAHNRWIDQMSKSDIKEAEQQFGCVLALIILTGLFCLLMTFLIVIFKP